MGAFIKISVNPRDMQKVKNTGKRINKGTLLGVKKGMKLFRTEARKFSGSNQLKIKSGALRDSIDYTVKESGGQIIGTLGSDKIYASIHEYGGTITARRAKFLIFKTKDGWRRVESVNIPPRPFLRPAIENNRDEVAKIINREVLKSFSSSRIFRR